MERSTKLPVFDQTAPYTIPLSYYAEGFRAFQKKYYLHRNYIMAGIFCLLLVTFVVSAVRAPENKLTYFLIMLCLACLFLLWYNPRKQRRMVLDAVRELEGDQYSAVCDGKTLCIQTLPQDGFDDDAKEEGSGRIPESRIQLDSAWVQEFAAFYFICKGKELFYILPKSAIGTVMAVDAIDMQNGDETGLETASDEDAGV